MPIKYETWQCAKCRQSYGSEEQALDCEKSHLEIVKVEADYYMRDKPKYPDSIKVTFSDGSIKVY